MLAKLPAIACIIIVFLRHSPNVLINASQRTGVLWMTSLNHQICIYVVPCGIARSGEETEGRGFIMGHGAAQIFKFEVHTFNLFNISHFVIISIPGGILVALLCLFMQKIAQ